MRLVCLWVVRGGFESFDTEILDSQVNRFFSNPLPWSQRIFPGRPYLSIKSLYNRSAAGFADLFVNGYTWSLNTSKY